MSDAYGLFALMAAGVIILGAALGIHPRLPISRRALQSVGMLTTINATLVGVGLLSVTFLGEQLIANEGALSLPPRSDLPSASALTLVMISVGISGLLMALIGGVFAGECKWVHRWGAVCLAVSSLAVLLLSPAVLAFIFSTVEAAS